MIHKLRIKFIAASMLSLALVLLVILGSVNVMSYQKILRDSDHILSLLSENEGRFPQQEPHMDSDGRKPDRHSRSGHGLSPETPFESRFFSVLLDENGQIIGTDTGTQMAENRIGIPGRDTGCPRKRPLNPASSPFCWTKTGRSSARIPGRSPPWTSPALASLLRRYGAVENPVVFKETTASSASQRSRAFALFSWIADGSYPISVRLCFPVF